MLISSKRFFDSSKFSTQTIMSSVNKGLFTPYPQSVSFISFSCLTALELEVRTSRVMLNRSNTRDIIVFFPYLNRKASTFPPLSTMSAVGFFADVIYQGFINISLILSLLKVFNISGYWILSNALTASSKRISFFLLSLLTMMDYINCF